MLDATGADFLRQLRRKYGVLAPAGAKRERPKGDAQPGPEDAFARAIRIYPVLVVHDERVGVPGSGKFLEDEFKILLGGATRRR